MMTVDDIKVFSDLLNTIHNTILFIEGGGEGEKAHRCTQLQQKPDTWKNASATEETQAAAAAAAAAADDDDDDNDDDDDDDYDYACR